MERRGSILVNRNMWGWWGWSDPFYVKAWMDLLLMAAWADHTRDFQGEPVRLKAGQIVTSQRILAKRWNVGIKRVRTFLRKVEKSNAIRTHQGAHQSTIITIRNYREYQSFENTKGHTKGRKAGARAAHVGRIPAPQKEQSNSYNSKELLLRRARRDIAQRLIEFLNEKAHRRYRVKGAAAENSITAITARLGEGATEDDCRSIIARKTREWTGDAKMNKYLRPSTLFNKTKFWEYHGELGTDAGIDQ